MLTRLSDGMSVKGLRALALGWVIVAIGCLSGGCSTATETGYEPRRLGMTEAERRAMYAAPFSPDAKGAEGQAEEMLKNRRPTISNY